MYVPLGSELISASGFSWPDEKVFRVPEPWTTKDETLKAVEKEIAIDPHSGTRVTAEFGKTAFGNWLITDPGATNRLQFTYRLPFKAFSDTTENSTPLWEKLLTKTTAPYQLVVQRQSGANSTFDSQIIFPSGWHHSWTDGENVVAATNGAQINSAPLVRDSVWSIIMQHN